MRYSAPSPIIQAQLRRLAGKQVREVTPDGDNRLTMTFSDGTTLVVGVNAGNLHRFGAVCRQLNGGGGSA